MTEERDPFLLASFAESQENLADDGFVAAVMVRTTKLKHLLLATGMLCTLALILCSWAFSWPLLTIAMSFSQVLSTELFSIGNSVAAWVLTPVNNLAAMLVVIWRVLRFGLSRATAARYSS